MHLASRCIISLCAGETLMMMSVLTELIHFNRHDDDVANAVADNEGAYVRT